MRSSVTIGFLAATFVALPALAQVPPRAPGELGPTPTSPIDTGFGTTQGTSPTGGSVQGTPPAPPTPPSTTVPTPALPSLQGPFVPGATPVPSAGTRPDQAPVAPEGVDMPLPEALRPQPNGLTADLAARRALSVSPAVRGAESNIENARAAQAEAGRSMIPQLTLSARYTRLSEYTPGTLSFFNTAGCLRNLAACQANPDSFVQQVVLQQPILNQYAVRASLAIPLSDLPFRLLRLYEAAGLQVEARQLDAEVTRSQAALDARLAYYDFLRATAQYAVARLSVEAQQRRRDDVARALEAGTASRNDFLRAEAALADLERAAQSARSGVDLAAALLRMRLHMREDEPLIIGESIDTPVAPPPPLADLVRRARAQRLEVLSIDRQLRAIDQNIAATRATQFPSVSLAGNIDIANPNPRIFPQTETFNTTWDASVNVVWSPTQAFVADATIGRLRAQRQQLAAQLETMREGFEMDVRSNYMAVQNARAAIQSARVQLASALENARVARERVGAGAATQTEMIAAEQQLLLARVALVNAQVDLRVALARLRRAVGEREPLATAASR